MLNLPTYFAGSVSISLGLVRYLMNLKVSFLIAIDGLINGIIGHSLKIHSLWVIVGQTTITGKNSGEIWIQVSANA